MALAFGSSRRKRAQRIYRDVGSVGLVSRFRGNERKDYAALRLAKKSPTRSSARRMFSVELA
jgi:hypothetical protein